MRNRSWILLAYAAATILFILLATSPSDDPTDQLARSGKIQEKAPVKASLEITINASPEKVWSLLADLKSWPSWHPDITSVEISGPLAIGTRFTWTTGGTTIHSQFAIVQPAQQLGWTGKAFGAKAIHFWNLKLLPDGRTLVRTDESMNGFLLSLFYSSKKLAETDQRWLNDLKVAAERPN